LKRRALLAAAGLAGCATPPRPAGPLPGPPSAFVLLAEFAWHTEVLMPGAGPGWLSWGFGARDFFTSPDPGLPEFLAALTPGPAAIVVTPRATPDRIVALPVGAEALAAIHSFLESELSRDAAGRPVPIAPGFSPGGMFYEARRRYSLAYTCNSWTMDALAAGGIPVRVRGVLTAADAMAEARRVRDTA
jgi:hypothetical protein